MKSVRLTKNHRFFSILLFSVVLKVVFFWGGPQSISVHRQSPICGCRLRIIIKIEFSTAKEKQSEKRSKNPLFTRQQTGATRASDLLKKWPQTVWGHGAMPSWGSQKGPTGACEPVGGRREEPRNRTSPCQPAKCACELRSRHVPPVGFSRLLPACGTQVLRPATLAAALALACNLLVWMIPSEDRLGAPQGPFFIFGTI